ncbi:MAG TPA: hypothetical protein VIY47_08030 [Ignavibacteriaceae bacterium]
MNNWVEDFFELNPDAVKVGEEKKKAKEYKNDLFKVVIPALDRRDKKFYGKLTEEQQKDISIWTLTRWMSSTMKHADIQLCNVNTIVNSRAKFLTKHKELQWMLLAVSGTGKAERHEWVAPPKGVKKNKIEETILQFFPLLRDDELELFQQINTVEDLEEFFKDNGFDDKTIEDLLSKGK